MNLPQRNFYRENKLSCLLRLWIDSPFLLTLFPTFFVVIIWRTLCSTVGKVWNCVDYNFSLFLYASSHKCCRKVDEKMSLVRRYRYFASISFLNDFRVYFLFIHLTRKKHNSIEHNNCHSVFWTLAWQKLARMNNSKLRDNQSLLKNKSLGI